MTARAGGVDLTGLGDVLDLPLLEDMPTLTTPEPYSAERCLDQIPMATDSNLRCDSGALVKPPSYPSLWGMDVKDDPYASHFLDPGTEEPDNLNLRKEHSADLSNESSPSTPPADFGVEQGTSSVDGLDASSGNTSLICGQPTGMCAQEQGIESLESELMRAGTHETQGSGSSADFISLLSMPGVLESMAALETTCDGQSIEDNEDWREFEAPQRLDMDFMAKTEPGMTDGRDTGPLEFPPRWQESCPSRKGGRATETGRSSARGRERAGVDARDTNPELSPEDAKRIRRMLSNRESARRSRHRKQAHLLDLENQVSQLNTEKGQLEEHLHQMAERLRAGDNENSSLKCQVENLRSKMLKLAAAINGGGPIPSLDDLKDNDDAFNSAGSSTRMDSKIDCLDHALLGHGQDTAGALRTRRRRLRTTRAGPMERSLKRGSF